MKQVILCVLALACVGCASRTVLDTYPSDAVLYIDGNHLGNTPYKYSDKKITGSETKLTFKKAGYEDLEVTLKRNEKVNGGAIAGGIFLGVPFFWTMSYDPTHTYDMTPIKSGKKKTKDD